MAYDNIKLEKGLYTTGKSFTKALEEIDPSENYIGTELEGLDAYQRQLKRFDIKVSGIGSDPVSKFFSTTDSAALFPEYISRAVRQGVEETDCLDNIIATTTEIDSLDYRAIESIPDNKNLEELEEGEAFPETTIKTKETLTTLKKRGTMLVASYEAIKFQKLDLFTVTLKQIGAHIAIQQLEDALSAIITDNINRITKSGPDFNYNDLAFLWSSIYPYKTSTLVMGTTDYLSLLKMPEFRDANAGLTFHATGEAITPFGSKVVRFAPMQMVGVLALDKNYAVEKVTAGGVLTEFDKLIDRQLERATISTITGFSKIFNDAVCLLNA